MGLGAINLPRVHPPLLGRVWVNIAMIDAWFRQIHSATRYLLIWQFAFLPTTNTDTNGFVYRQCLPALAAKHRPSTFSFSHTLTLRQLKSIISHTSIMAIERTCGGCVDDAIRVRDMFLYLLIEI